MAKIPLMIAALFGMAPAAFADDGPRYGIGGRCVAFAETAPAGLVVTTPEAPLPVEVVVNGRRDGWLYTCCGVDDERCRDIPSSGFARELGIDRDCGRVNARELASCLGVEVQTPTNYQLFIRTR